MRGDSVKKYQIIYADPPWSYQDKGCNGNCEAHYKTMSIKDICELPVKEIADKDCVLFLWTTYPMLQEAMLVIDAWGFKYKSIGFQWIKLNKKSAGEFYGLGRWTRGNTEPCLIAVKGKPKRISASVSQIIKSPVSSHSKKPNEARKRIVRLMGDLPRIELFARGGRDKDMFGDNKFDGWDVWGNEVESDIVLTTPERNK
jgi:N6-adenosine-specific RNA methylase IME4